MLTLAAVAENPLALTRHLELADGPEVVWLTTIRGRAWGLRSFRSSWTSHGDSADMILGLRPPQGR
ncbi:hypothetical protein [Streptomyces nanshensis]|uniref:Uncharacterized protein n=1 Tax=Streptomyces nanshensis TaxID=518642 RepID=A0A1E7KXB3_9ACTN|nr:hypothetical protein [Streptomyces nanshensis]OEV08473.1 hypothetical protein AN218_26390 [Streptomyces nanshensis]